MTDIGPTGADPQAELKLSVAGLRHRFGDRLAVDGVDFTVAGGEIVGLVGRNGAGKTTTMRAVMGILRPQEAEITWRGHPVDFDDRLRFGYMPEERGLYPQMRVLPQLVYFARLCGLDRATAGRRAGELLGRLDLAARAQDQTVSLSHGNQQRVQLAVAIVHDPDLFVLDEPFAGLDPSVVDDLSGILHAEAQRGRAVLFSSHQLDLVERLCDRVVILEKGRVLAAGTLDELRAHLPLRLRVKVDAPAGWEQGLAGVRAEDEDGEGAVFDLDSGADAQAVLAAAQAAGPVEQFGYERGHLVDVYRELVRR
ncbi:MAG: ATP-binding cassette domain-containing protein [Thermoleophilia bacterium]